MKNIKNFKLKISMLILVLVLMVVQIGPFLVYADESRLTFSYQKFDQPATNEYYNGKNLYFAQARVGQYVGYCLDYGLPLPTSSGGTVSYLRTLSPVTTAVLKYGYPYYSAAQLGVNSNEEAELATQLAVWSVVNASSFEDSQKATKVLDLDNLKPVAGYESYMERVKAAAQRLINRAVAAPYYSDPKFYINPANAKMTVGSEYMIAGPYEVKATGFDVSSVTASLANAPASAVITDANGNEKTTVSNGDNIYVRMLRTEEGSELTINVGASGSTVIGKVYGTGNMSDGKQDYGLLVQDPVQLNDSTKLIWTTLTGNVKIIKVDQYDNIISGVKFELRDMNDKVVTSGTTNAQGILEFNDIKIGNYKLVETEVPEGYIMATEAFEFEVSVGNTKEITFQNKKIAPGKIKITKIDQHENTIAGCSFDLKDANGKVIYSGTTDKNGILEFDNLVAGKYYLQETSAPSGYEMKKDAVELNVPNNKVLSLKFPNRRINGGLKIIKVDENKDPLAGVTFEILDANKNVIDTIVTNEDGIAETTAKLTVGKYYYREISAPNNIIIDTNEYEFTINGYDEVVIKNIMNNIKKGKLSIYKTTEDNKPLEGVTFQILDSNKKVVDTVVTNANGVATTKELKKGTYYYKETKVPYGIRLDSTEYEFTMDYLDVRKDVVNKYATGALKILKVDENDIPVKGVKFEIYDANQNLVDTIVTDANGVAQSKEITLGTYYYKEVEAPSNVIMDTEMHKFEVTKDGEVVIKNIVNKLVKGKLRITKVTETGTPVENVTFQILNEAKEVIETITTDKDGIAETKSLQAGKYYYRETEAPVNVIADYTEYEFVIESNEQILEKTVVNELVKGSLKIIKTDDLKAPLANVKFEILDKDKNVIEIVITDENGIAISEKLTIGKYYYREVEAPENVVMDTKEHDFRITENDQVVEVNVENKRIEGKLIIYKLDKDTKQPLANVTFQVFNEAKEVIATITTDNEGIARLGGLVKGIYSFKEVEALEDYIMNTEEFTFEIVKDMQTVEKTVYNEHIKLPVTGGFIGTNTLIVIIVAVVVIAGYVTIKLILNRKNARNSN